ncbi:unnamed protein product [Linum trigynum]|uniref:Uncharacterized protein n=1 Tax=Linum trigynum TaxID=586398 RepID=A0AAV2FNL9_9ROSI
MCRRRFVIEELKQRFDLSRYEHVDWRRTTQSFQIWWEWQERGEGYNEMAAGWLSPHPSPLSSCRRADSGLGKGHQSGWGSSRWRRNYRVGRRSGYGLREEGDIKRWAAIGVGLGR